MKAILFLVALTMLSLGIQSCDNPPTKNEQKLSSNMKNNEMSILFVQIQPNAFTDEMDALSNRQLIEEELDAILKQKNLGTWIAGDLGPGGANMLFEVIDLNKSVAIILEHLSSRGLIGNTIIAQQVNTSEDDWEYEVIYPKDFIGEFNSM